MASVVIMSVAIKTGLAFSFANGLMLGESLNAIIARYEVPIAPIRMRIMNSNLKNMVAPYLS